MYPLSTRCTAAGPRPWILAVGLWTAAAVPACEPGEPGETAGAAREATVPAAPPGPVRRLADQPPSWKGGARLELIREVRGAAVVGTEAADSTRPVFAAIRDVSADADGRILVLDGDEARVTVLDRRGRVRSRLGRRGPGPGELRTPDRVEPSSSGGVLVFERRPAAVHRWDSTGHHRGTTGLATSDSGSAAITGLADWGGAVAGARAVRLIGLRASDPSASTSAVHVADASGRIGDPVVSWSTPGTRSRLPEVFGARRSWAAGDGPDGSGRIFVARGDRYEIRSYDTAGALRTVLRRDVEPVPVSDELRERALDRFVEEAGRAGAPPAMTRELRDRLPVAESLPPIAGLWHSAPDGRLWVGIPGPGAGGERPMVVRAWDVYEADGRFVGRVDAPRGFQLHRVRGGRLYGSWRDSLDVPGVRVYRLVEPSG